MILCLGKAVSCVISSYSPTVLQWSQKLKYQLPVSVSIEISGSLCKSEKHASR